MSAAGMPILFVASSTAAVVVAFTGLFFVWFVFLGIWASRYAKVGPDQVMVISGRVREIITPDGEKRKVGWRLMTGGGTFVWPVYETVAVLSLKPFPLNIAFKSLPLREGEVAEFRAKALFRIPPTEPALFYAATSLLGKTQEEIGVIGADIIESALRAHLAVQSGKQIEQNRGTLGQELQTAADQGLAKVGLEIVSLSVITAEVMVRTRERSRHRRVSARCRGKLRRPNRQS